jgi:hypothetical protein
MRLLKSNFGLVAEFPFFAYKVYFNLGFGWWGYWDGIPRFIKPEKIIKK